MPDGNQGWTNDWEGRWKEREWYDRDTNWRDSERDEYVLLYDSQVQREQSVSPESCRTKDMLTRILIKVERSDMVLQELKTGLFTLSQVMTSHSTSIEQLESQMGRMSAHFFQANTKKEGTQSLAVLTRSGKKIGNEIQCDIQVISNFK